ncbi:hypothetical protein N0V83_006321 [Neocucurbitaria cava]|uniref:Uncharacterized protein n=1 Tax=Neocucurbitaria cava TaxID=798079 RepID=A0A9W8Y7N8_9PLEO|nr:hypothetical protein N0V83_006321 [Neocucurbitaria cava]
MALDRRANEDPIPESIRVEIIKGLWQCNTAGEHPIDIKRWDAFFSYYTAERKKAIAYSRGEYTTVRKHQDITAIANKLEGGCTKEEVTQSLLSLDTQQRSKEAKIRMVEGSLRLVARLISMVDIGPLPYCVQGRAPILWSNANSGLNSVLEEYFQKSSTSEQEIKFGEDFTAFNIQQFAGLQIQWTNNLANHLRVMDNDTTLCLFYHVTFLRHQNSAIFPEGLMEETLRTLALLFPRNDKNTRKWLLTDCFSTNNIFCLDMQILNGERVIGEQRRAETYEFWRDELLTLKEIFDKPRPTSLVHFWYDRRNKAQWYTFWIAVLILCLTIFFGLIQSIEDAQRRKALKELPKTLHESYDRILLRVVGFNAPIVVKTLQWFAFSTPYIEVDALLEAFSIDGEISIPDPEAQPTEEDLLTLCGSLIRKTNGHLELAHFTVLEYLKT